MSQPDRDEAEAERVGDWPATEQVVRAWKTNPDQRGLAGTRPNREDRMLTQITVEVPAEIARLPLNVSSTATAACEEARASVAQLEHAGGLAGLSALLMRSESVASSRIEAVYVDMDDWARASINAMSSTMAAETMAALDALRQLTESCDNASRLTEQAIFSAHTNLMGDNLIEGSFAGQYRTMQNWLGGSDHTPRNAVHIPPPPGEIPRLMADLVEFANRDDLPAVAQAAVVHGQFEAIHPFTDGNGRIGRALISAVHRRRGVTSGTVVPVAAAMLSDIDGYFQRLVDYRHGDVDGMVWYVATTTRDAARESIATASRLAALPERWHQLVGARQGSASQRLVDRLIQAPVVDIVRVEELTGASRRRAYDAVDRLVQARVLDEITGADRNRIWVASEVLGELSDLETRIGRRSVPSSRWR